MLHGVFHDGLYQLGLEPIHQHEIKRRRSCLHKYIGGITSPKCQYTLFFVNSPCDRPRTGSVVFLGIQTALQLHQELDTFNGSHSRLGKRTSTSSCHSITPMRRFLFAFITIITSSHIAIHIQFEYSVFCSLCSERLLLYCGSRWDALLTHTHTHTLCSVCTCDGSLPVVLRVTLANVRPPSVREKMSLTVARLFRALCNF